MLNKKTISILLFIAVLFISWRIFNQGVLIEHASLSGKFESEVNDLLSQQGIEDENILKNIRIEHKSKFPTYSSWIETEREILLPSRKKLSILKRQLKSASIKYNLGSFTVEPYYETRSAKEKGSVIEIGKKDRVFQRIIFLYP